MKVLLKKIPFLPGLVNWYRNKSLSPDPKVNANRIYRNVFHKDINWNNPRNLIEKICWMEIYADTSLWTYCSDKYLVREFVEKRGCVDSLNELYGHWDRPEDIDWDKLPKQFVLKSNHACGQVIIVKNKSTLKIQKTVVQLKQWLSQSYGLWSAQLHYTKIKPCIIAEKLLGNSKEDMIDYKIWCFNGKPEGILVVYDRTDNNYKLSYYDLQWNNISEKVLRVANKHYSGGNVTKPASFNSMIEIAEKLSIGFPQIRVDFYDINGKAIFGELTFSTGYGYFTNDYYDYLGNLTDLSLVKRFI